MLKKFISYYKNHMNLFILDMVAAIFISILGLVFPIVTKYFMEDLIPSKNIKMIIIAGFALLGIYLLRMGGTYIVNFWGHMMGTGIEADMRNDLFKKMQTLDIKFFDENKTGKLMTNLVGHLRDISEMSHHAPEDLFISAIMIIGSFILLLRINVQFTLIVFIFIVILIIFSLKRRIKMLEGFRETRATHAEINSTVENSIGGVRLTKAYTNESYEISKFEKVNNNYKMSWINAYKQMAIFVSGNGFIIDLINVVILVYGGYLISVDILTVTEWVTYFLYISFLTTPVRRIIFSMEQIQKGWTGFERFYSIMQIEPKIKSKENAIILRNPKGKIEFREVNFSYEAEENYVLKDFNLIVNPGDKVALVGETGVGKSTISKLIPRFYEIDSGNVFVDDVSVQDYEIYSLRSNIGHVQQDVYIFWGSIADNILYGNPDASYDEVVDAAKKAKIHDFIMTLDDGYDTLVGERGVKLSGGQKQRLSIARVFLKNPPILILDEATSSLDNITEEMIQTSLDELSKGRTTIVIAHRLSTVKNSKEIIVLGKTGVIERGNHNELINNNGYYSKLYNSSLMK